MLRQSPRKYARKYCVKFLTSLWRRLYRYLVLRELCSVFHGLIRLPARLALLAKSYIELKLRDTCVPDIYDRREVYPPILSLFTVWRVAVHLTCVRLAQAITTRSSALKAANTCTCACQNLSVNNWCPICVQSGPQALTEPD